MPSQAKLSVAAPGTRGECLSVWNLNECNRDVSTASLNSRLPAFPWLVEHVERLADHYQLNRCRLWCEGHR
jgi:hypothetical protein